MSFVAKLTPSELNYLLTMGAVPPSQMVRTPVYETHTVLMGRARWGDPIYEPKKVQVGTSIAPTGELAKHYPKGVIPQRDLAVLQQGA